MLGPVVLLWSIGVLTLNAVRWIRRTTENGPNHYGQGQYAWNHGSSQRYHISGTWSRIVTSSLQGRNKKMAPTITARASVRSNVIVNYLPDG
jgi:hypothetical protein